jgi:hypothetical protein
VPDTLPVHSTPVAPEGVFAENVMPVPVQVFALNVAAGTAGVATTVPLVSAE